MPLMKISLNVLLVLGLFGMGTVTPTVAQPLTEQATAVCDQLWEDGKTVVLSPLQWQRDEWQKAGLVVVLAAGLYSQDQAIRDTIQARRNASSDRLADWVRPFGEGQYTLPLLAGFYYYGRRNEDEQASKVAVWGTESFLVSSAVTLGLKTVAHRHRPNTGARYDTWDGPDFSLDNDSFPSHHTASAFAVATVVATVYREQRWIPVLAYSTAALTGWSRMNDDVHWASDVFVGAVIGYYTAKTIMARSSRESQTAQFEVRPNPDGSMGVVYRIRF